MQPVKIVDQPDSNVVFREDNINQEEAPNVSYLGKNTKDETENEQHSPIEAPWHTEVEKPQVGKPKPFSHHIWDPEIRPMLIAYLKPVFMMTLIVMVMVWLFCSIYWGSMYGYNENSPRIVGAIVNRDNGIIGQSITQAYLDLNGNDKELPHSTWELHDPSEYPDHASLANTIQPKETFYIALEIVEGATDKLIHARDTGDSSYDPRVVNIIFATAMNPTTVPSYITGPAQKTFGKAQVKLNAQLTSQFLSENANNPEAIQTANRAPLTLVNPVASNMIDLRPWKSNVGMAPTFVGMIYLVILAFQIVMAEYMGRFAIQPFLHFKAFAILRIATPMVASLFVSVMISLLNIPFDLPFDAMFTYGAGFMVYWMCTLCGIVVFMLCLESVITITTPKFIGVFLVLFIISNVSVSNSELKLQPSFYLYGYAMPFYNLRRIYLAVMFNVGERLEILKYIGIIWAWIFAVAASFALIIWLEYLKRFKAHKKSLEQNKAP